MPQSTHHFLSPEPNWGTKLPSEYVHKSNPDAAWVTSVTRSGTKKFLVAAIAPDSDPLTYIEVMRQATIAVGHLGYRVPLGTRFLMSEVSFSMDETSPYMFPHPLLISIYIVKPAIKREQLYHTRLNIKLSRPDVTGNGYEFAHGSGFLICTSADMFARLEGRLERSNGGNRYPLLSPAIVAKKTADEVVLAGSDYGMPSGQWRIVVNPDAFDHPSRHLPGMNQLEVMRQAGHAIVGVDKQLVGVDAHFLRMVHPRAELYCRAEVRLTPRIDGRGKARAQVRVELTDHDKSVFAHGIVEYAIG